MKRFNLFAALAAVAALAAAPLFPASAVAATGVTIDAGARVVGTYSQSVPLGSATLALNLTGPVTFTAGTASGQADLAFVDQRTLTASSTENLDLAGVLADKFGNVLTFGHVKLIYIHAAATNTNDVCVGGAATNTFSGPFADPTDKVCVKPGAVAFLTVFTGVGWTVTPATGDILKVANSSSGTSVVYDVVILGTST
jgi:hypothetical protein